jgi:twitching motility protein PilT
MTQKQQNRVNLRADVLYSKKIPGITTEIFEEGTAFFISPQSIQFCAFEELIAGSDITVKLKISSEEYIPFECKVIGCAPPLKNCPGNRISAQILDCDADKQNKMYNFLMKIDIEGILGQMVLDDVVDVYFVAGCPPIVKKYGDLLTYEMEDFDRYVLQIMLFSILDDEMHQYLINERESNFVWTSNSGKRFRVNLHYQRKILEGTFRLIPDRINKPSDLGLPHVVETLLTNNKKGLIMIAGRTGSGKSTTIASMLDFINNRRSNIIICIEDPIEYIHDNASSIIKQREVGSDTKSYARAAKNALRQNPDVLVVGEILDRETMDTAITAAETGSLVLTTIHAGTVTLALDRVATFFPAELQPHILKRLALVLKGIIVQELIPRMDGKGVALASEIIIANNAVQRAIRDADWNQIKSIIQLSKKDGMQSMADSLSLLYKAGRIGYEYLEENV